MSRGNFLSRFNTYSSLYGLVLDITQPNPTSFCRLQVHFSLVNNGSQKREQYQYRVGSYVRTRKTEVFVTMQIQTTSVEILPK